MSHSTETPTPQDPQLLMAEICTALTQTLSAPTTDHIDALQRQAALLNDLLYAVMRKNMERDVRRGFFDDDRLALALRIQKQCVDTLKAASAIEYMRGLSGGAPTPLFLRNKQKGMHK